MFKFKNITVNDINEFSQFNMRLADIEELRASTGIINPLDALEYAIKFSTEWTEVCFDEDTGEIFTVFGLGKYEDFGIPWAVASPSIIKHQKAFMRYSKLIINKMLDQFPLIQNYVDSRNEVHIRWLKHMGFSFCGRDLVVRGVRFKYFYKRREKNHV